PIFIFHDLLNDDKAEVSELKERYVKGTVGDVEVKERLFAAHKRTFKDARERRNTLKADEEMTRRILRKGAEEAANVANQTLREVYETIGIINSLNKK
ncbi:MAG: Tryptophan-tRNA ligase, partial [Microgenomates group bacterium GW2011_GWC1_44_9]